MDKPQPENNLALWNRNRHTDPKYTKRVNQRGGYTAINPQSQLRAATAEWGPYGSTWGIRNLDFKLLQFPEDSSEVRPTLYLIAEFWYPGGSFPIAVDMPFRANDDAYKKLLTEARSKALSYLGFNADIFLGQWDDNRYVSEMQTRYSESEGTRQQALLAIKQADSPEKLAKCKERCESLFANDHIDKVLFDELKQAVESRQSDLNEGEKES